MVEVGETVIDAVVAPVLHEIVPVQAEEVSVTDSPAQIAFLLAVTTGGVTAGATVTVTVD